MRKSAIGLIVGMLCVSMGFAQSVNFSIFDQNTAMKVTAGSDAAVITIDLFGAGTNKVVTGGATNYVYGTGTTDTVAEVAAVIAAATNASGEFLLSVDTSMSLGTDSTDGELLSGTYTAAANSSVSIPWATEKTKYYTVGVPKGNLDYVYGAPRGTGTLYLAVYDGGTLIFQDLVYAVTTNAGALEEEDFGGVGLPITTKGIVRYTLGTTADNGNIGAVVGKSR